MNRIGHCIQVQLTLEFTPYVGRCPNARWGESSDQRQCPWGGSKDDRECRELMTD
jgi:uncharacterized protein involved in copper resistance